MNEETLNRIAIALEKIANLMENKEKREINESLKKKRTAGPDRKNINRLDT